MTHYEIFTLISDAQAITGEQLSSDEHSRAMKEMIQAWDNGESDWDNVPTKEQGIALVAIGLKILKIVNKA